jgi:predicted ATPase/DNA-binding CsgD family transcriptional regulator
VTATNLPATPTALIGRARELEVTRALIRRPDVRLLTLTGAGGTGKTRLAFQLAGELLDDFDDGVFAVELASIRDPALVASAVARTLGFTDAGDRPLVEGLKGWLGNRRVLIVLDNFEHLLDAAQLVAELLEAAGRLKVLATSRAPLHISAEHEYPVPPLAVPDAGSKSDVERLARTEAVELFTRRAQAVRPEFSLTAANAEAVAEICVRLDGLPLAIELAAARAKLLSPQEIRSRLGQRLALLTGGASDQPLRQRTLRATIDWSYELLPPEDRALFRRLAIFIGGCTLEAAQAVAGENDRDILDGIASLVNKSVLQAETASGGETRFRMLETIREYALECLIESGEIGATERRHAQFCCALAERAEPQLRGPSQEEWLARLDADYDNLRGALAWSAQPGEAEVGLRLASALWRFWQIRGYLTEGRERVELLLALTNPSDRTPGRAGAQTCVGSLAFFQGDYDRARALFNESLETQRHLRDLHGIAFATYYLGMVDQRLGDYSAASALYAQSRAAFLEAGDAWGEAMAFQGLGQAADLLGDPAGARSLFEEGIRLCRKLGDHRNVAVLLGGVGTVALEQGDHSDARGFFTESLAIHRELGDTYGIPTQLSNLGFVALREGNYEAAKAFFVEALAFRRKTGDTPGLASSLEGFAGLAVAEGRLAAAARLLGAASVLREGLIDHFFSGRPARDELETARARLGRQAYDAAWEDGRSLTLEAALAYAVGDHLLEASSTQPSSEGVPEMAIDTGPLSRREQEVAKLVAAGMTNRQIAKRLFISERTAEGHVEHIRNKLGVRSRTEIATWVVKRVDKAAR